MMHVLFGHIGVVPEHFLVEPTGGDVMIHPANVYSNDSFQRLEHRTCPEAVHRVGPLRSFPQVHRIVDPSANPNRIATRLAVSRPSVSINSLRSSPIAAALTMTTR